MRVPLVVLSILLVALAAHAAAAPADRRIVPGDRIGPLRLGATVAAVTRAMGEPSKRNDASDRPWLWWGTEGLGAWFQHDRAVTLMLRENRAYRTAEGIGIGTDRERVVAGYGGSYQAEEDADSLVITYRQGIAFAFDKRQGSGVSAILVFRPRR